MQPFTQQKHSKAIVCVDFGPTNAERPLIFSLTEVEEATVNFDERRKIGEGGFGSVYHGILGKQVWIYGSSVVYTSK